MEIQLHHVYGPIINQVFDIYAEADPLSKKNKQEYWLNINKFLEQFHNILYKPGTKYHIRSISPDSYFFVCQMCVTDCFDIFDRIEIMNKKDKKYCKIISNKIAHEVIPNYISYLREVRDHKHYKDGVKESTYVKCNPHHKKYSMLHKKEPAPQVPRTPTPSSSTVPVNIPGVPYTNVSGSPVHMWVLGQHGGIFPMPLIQPSPAHASVPTPAPVPTPTPASVPVPTPVHRSSFFGNRTQLPEMRMTENPIYGRSKQPKKTQSISTAVGTSSSPWSFPPPPLPSMATGKKPWPPSLAGAGVVVKPSKKTIDTVPLNFYTVFGKKDEKKHDKLSTFEIFNNPPQEHSVVEVQVPNHHPVPTYPPPPKVRTAGFRKSTT